MSGTVSTVNSANGGVTANFQMKQHFDKKKWQFMTISVVTFKLNSSNYIECYAKVIQNFQYWIVWKFAYIFPPDRENTTKQTKIAFHNNNATTYSNRKSSTKKGSYASYLLVHEKSYLNKTSRLYRVHHLFRWIV